MNRAQRRQAQFKRGQRWNRNDGHASRAMSAIHWTQDFTEDDAARLSTEARLAWHHLTNGSATTDHFDTLACIANVTMIRAEGIEGGELCVETALRGQQALIAIKRRVTEGKRLGVCAQSLRDVPPLLDLYDELVKHSNPRQMVEATREAMRRINNREVLEITK